MTRVRPALHGAAALVLAALLVGPSAHASEQPAPARAPAVSSHGQPNNEWLMMGRNCGASMS